MEAKEIKLFIRFLKNENFYFKYKKFFFDEKIGVDCRKFQCKYVYEKIDTIDKIDTIQKYLAFVNKYTVFNGFWWATANHAYYREISNLRKKWLRYYEKIIQ